MTFAKQLTIKGTMVKGNSIIVIKNKTTCCWRLKAYVASTKWNMFWFCAYFFFIFMAHCQYKRRKEKIKGSDFRLPSAFYSFSSLSFCFIANISYQLQYLMSLGTFFAKLNGFNLSVLIKKVIFTPKTFQYLLTIPNYNNFCFYSWFQWWILTYKIFLTMWAWFLLFCNNQFFLEWWTMFTEIQKLLTQRGHGNILKHLTEFQISNYYLYLLIFLLSQKSHFLSFSLKRKM